MLYILQEGLLDLMNKIAGVDEAGRGPLAGPVVAACVILPFGATHQKPIAGLRDSKKLTAKAREYLYNKITAQAIDWAVGDASVEEIEELNILQATLLAMRRAVLALTQKPNLVLVDGNQGPKIPYETQTIIRGDSKEPAISAASIIAKVTRDKIMLELDERFPEYGFQKHKGYGTKQHIDAIYQYGPSIHHRRGFEPIRTFMIQKALGDPL